MATRNLFFNSAAGYVATIVSIAIGIASKMLLTRILSPHDLGLLILAQTLFGMVVFLASLGMADTMARFIGGDAKTGFAGALPLVAKGLRLVVGSGGVFALVAIPLAPFAASHLGHDPKLAIAVTLFAMALPFKLAADLIGSANQGVGKLYLKLLIVDLCPALGFLAGLAILRAAKVNSFRVTVIIYLVPMILSPFCFRKPLALSALWQRRQTATSYKALLHYSTPLLLSGIVAWPLTLVPVVIGSVVSAEAVSYYSLALSLASFVYLGASVTEAAGLSVWSSYLGDGRPGQLEKDYRLSTRWGVIVGSIVFSIFLVRARDVVSILFGPKYESVAHLLPLVSLIVFSNLLTGPTESILKAYGETRLIFVARLAVGLAVLATLYGFLKLWGVYGAVAVFGLSTAVGSLGIYSGVLYKKHGLHPMDGHLLMALVSIASSCLITFAVSAFLSWTSPWINVISSSVVYLTMLVAHLALLRGIAPRDRELLAHLSSGIGLLGSKLGLLLKCRKHLRPS